MDKENYFDREKPSVSMKRHCKYNKLITGNNFSNTIVLITPLFPRKLNDFDRPNIFAGARAWQSLIQFLNDAQLCEAMETVSRYLISNPVLLAACIAVISAVAVPLLLFILFAIVNVAFAFTSFIVIEGKLTFRVHTGSF